MKIDLNIYKISWVLNLDNPDVLVKGNGMFVDDITFPEMLHMAVIRSPYGRARILSISGGLNAAEFNPALATVLETAGKGREAYIQHVFANGSVNYYGEPVAAVFGNSIYEALDNSEKVRVEYDPMKAIVSIDDALIREPLYPGLNNNIMVENYVGQNFEMLDAPVMIKDTFFNDRISPNPIETRGLIASYKSGLLDIWMSVQAASSLKIDICKTLDLDPDKVRIIQADTGGGFGSKGGIMYPEYAMAIYASMKSGKPVKWIETREEHLKATCQGRGVRGEMTLYANENGRVLGIKGTVTVDGGAYAGGMAEFAPAHIVRQLTGVYQIENAYFRAVSVYTNKVPHGPYRGAGMPEASFFIERMMDRLADKLNMDPIEIRLINATKTEFRSPLGMEIGPSARFVAEAAKEFDYDRLRNTSTGFSCFVLVPQTDFGESARIKIENGKVNVWLGSNTHGQRHEVVVKRLLREELEVSEDIITLLRGDTSKIRDGFGSGGSRSIMMGGTALIFAARKIKDQIRKTSGKYSSDVLLSSNFDVSYNYSHEGEINSFGANFAKVSIDESGGIKVEEVKSYYDVGRLIDPEGAKAQVMGGVLQGIGQVLSERIIYDENGQLLTSGIAEAGLLRADNTPRFVVNFVENPSCLPHGAKRIR